MPGERRVGGRYLLQREIAAGGMGTVWQARDETLRRDVAIKVLHLQPGVADSEREQAVERAMREARIAARLHHPNAVQVYDVVDDDSGPCLIMQYVPSRSLAAVVAEDGPLPPHEVARLGTQVAAALAAAHRVGIVHRDVKPGNLLMADDGTVKITDFGVSHAFDDVTVTSTGMVTGTPAYIAPEVARGEDSTAASDVYALGSTLYYAVEGRPPFGDDKNPMAVLHRVASGRPDRPQRAGALGPMLQAMMAPAPADRPKMVEIAGRLPELHPLTRDGAAPAEAATQVLRRTPATVAAPRPAAPPLVVRPDQAPAERERRRTWIPLAAAVLVVLLGVVLAVVLLRNASDTGDGETAAGPGATAPLSPSPTPSSSTEQSAPPSTSDTPAPATTTTTTTTTSPAPTPTTATPAPAAAPSASELSAAIVSYFQLIPGDLDAGWARLTSTFQQDRAGGRASYDEYWATVNRVDVQDPRGEAPRTVTARLVYRYKNGNVVRQTTTFRLVREDGVLKIDGQS